MIVYILSTGHRIKSVLTLALLCQTCCLSGQDLVYSYFYRIYLKDKGTIITGNYSALDLMSPRAVLRRQKAGIPAPDFRDIPVDRNYLNQISLLGLKLHSTSKWMNTALFKSQSLFDINKLLELSFVSDVKLVKMPGKKSSFTNKLDFQIIQADLPPYDRPLTMINAVSVHGSGFKGKNVLIAILDGGFTNAENITSLDGLRSRKGIKTTYDFVNNNRSVYNTSSHGTAVLSVLAGETPGQIEGTAPEADFLLIKTEDVASEFPCEEDFWAAGAEFADSLGADVISSSLGYFQFDNSTLNYKISDLDGKTAFVTRVAEIAASRGIIVVNSAGNERSDSWQRIIFPADGDSILAVGAVDGNNIIADFSSAGPSADGRVKPDNVAMGVNVPVQISGSSIVRSNGTSFSCPILSGMAACLLQAVPLAHNSDIIEAMHTTGDRYNLPDSLYGYGIPDLGLALTKLQNLYVKIPDKGVIVCPNPTTGDFEIIFSSPPVNVTIEIFSVSGRLIFRSDYTNFAGRAMIITELQHRPQGLYLVRVTNGSEKNVRKIIKINT